MRRLTRLTNALSKKWSNLKAALSLHFAYYNFCRKHMSLKVDTSDGRRIDRQSVESSRRTSVMMEQNKGYRVLRHIHQCGSNRSYGCGSRFPRKNNIESDDGDSAQK